MTKYLENCQFKFNSGAKFATDNEIHVWKIPATDYTDNTLSDLSGEEKEKLSQLKNPQTKKVFFSSRQAIRKLFSSYLDCPANQLEFAVHKQGKPFLASHDKKLEFNLSHSADRILLAVSRQGPVGIDIEACRNLDNWQAIARKVFDRPTMEKFLQMKDPEAQFFHFWTEFEAKKKLSGQGIFAQAERADNIETILFEPDIGYQAALAFKNQKSAPKLHFYYFDINSIT